MIKTKRLKSGVLRITDTDHPGTVIDIEKPSEQKRQLPIILQVAGYSSEARDKFLKQLEE